MIAERIAEYINAKGIKQRPIAEAVGMSPVAMSETLRGNRTLTAEEYVGICNFLEVPYSKFVDGK